MDSLITEVIAWPTLLASLLIFGFAPGAMLRVIVLAFRRDDPRRKELLAELPSVPRIERPFWVFEQLELALFEGLAGRLVTLIDQVQRYRRWPLRAQPPAAKLLGGQITYDGENGGWLLALTRAARRSIQSISLMEVNTGVSGSDSGLRIGGLWISDLGIRYLALQREAVSRGVHIQRIFVIANEDLVGDETFHMMAQMQRDAGVEIRLIDQQLIPDWMRSVIFDRTVFDEAVSYEMSPVDTFPTGQTGPTVTRTMPALRPTRARNIKEQFEQLWEFANPERQIEE